VKVQTGFNVTIRYVMCRVFWKLSLCTLSCLVVSVSLGL